MHTSIFGQPLHMKRKKAVRINKSGYNIIAYPILFWLIKLKENNPKRRVKEENNGQVTNFA